MTRRFQNPDGSEIEVRTNQACCWHSDACQCIIVFEQDILSIDYDVVVCALHKTLTGQALLDAVLAHNQSFNVPTGDLTERQRNDQALAREAEARRILALGTRETRADSATKDAIETSLRARGR